MAAAPNGRSAPAVGLTRGVLVATVLIVEDNPDHLRILEFALSRAGHEVITAEEGTLGVDLARRARPDLILLDIALPGLDGHEVCRELKADSALAEIPIVMLTALGSAEEEARARRSGVTEFLSKPFDPDEVARTVTRCVVSD